MTAPNHARSGGLRDRVRTRRARPLPDVDPDTMPGEVIATVSAAVVPAPFLFVYAGLFLVHGLLVTPSVWDIGGGRSAEIVAGVLAVLLLVLVLVGLGNLLSGMRRWTLAAGQTVVLGGSIYLIVDRTSGPLLIPVLVAATSALALLLVSRPIARAWIRAQD